MSKGKVSLVQTGNVIEVEAGKSIKQVLADQDWVLTDSNEVRLNGAICTDFDTMLNAGDQVMVIGEIEGG